MNSKVLEEELVFTSETNIYLDCTGITPDL